MPVVTAGVAAALADPMAKGPYFLACDGDDVVGQLQVTYEWSDWRNGWFWWIQSVYVRADSRGRGVFGTLYRHVRQSAHGRGQRRRLAAVRRAREPRRPGDVRQAGDGGCAVRHDARVAFIGVGVRSSGVRKTELISPRPHS